MRDSFNAYRFLSFLLRRWMFVAAVCAAASAIALAVSLLLPKRYTATASIIIEAPAGSDPRAATAVSPVYLESLKTYEQFASSDSLFLRALDRFHLAHDATDSVETFKRRVLKVSKLRDTKLLQISATLANPRQAHELAQYIAEETVNLSRMVARQADQHSISALEKQLETAQTRLAGAQSRWEQFAAREPVDALQAEIDSDAALKSGADRDLLEARTAEAEYAARAKDLASAAPDSSGERASIERELAAVRAKVSTLEKQSAALGAGIARKSALLGSRTAQRSELQNELKSAQTAFEASGNRLRDSRAVSGFRSESLEIIDPGIVPERPSSPNLPLNVAAALAAALAVSLLYLTAAFGYRNARAEDLASTYRLAGRAND